MEAYQDKRALITEIRKRAEALILEFDGIQESDKVLRFPEVDRTPQEMIAYQLGWMGLLLEWEQEELTGKPVITPAPGYQWNQLGKLYQHFYDQYHKYSLQDLREMFLLKVDQVTAWIEGFDEAELFSPGGRKWAASTPANWPVWKWIHINTVAPFKSFRTKIRKWKKLKAAM